MYGYQMVSIYVYNIYIYLNLSESIERKTIAPLVTHLCYWSWCRHVMMAIWRKVGLSKDLLCNKLEVLTDPV